MAEAELLIVIGSRAVCQADCSGIGYKNGRSTSSTSTAISPTPRTTTARWRSSGDISAVAERLAAKLEAAKASANKRDWLAACAAKKAEWAAYKRARFEAAPIRDEVWQRPALGQPAAIKIVADFAKEIGAAKFFDAGDVQANGFQIVEDDRTGDTFTETGASYMGFAASALLASAHRRQAALRHRLHRRRLLHDEPADPDRRRRARRARHDRDLRQPPHGRHHRPADGAVRRRLPHQRSASPSTTCASPAPSPASTPSMAAGRPTS